MHQTKPYQSCVSPSSFLLKCFSAGIQGIGFIGEATSKSKLTFSAVNISGGEVPQTTLNFDDRCVGCIAYMIEDCV